MAAQDSEAPRPVDPSEARTISMAGIGKEDDTFKQRKAPGKC